MFRVGLAQNQIFNPVIFNIAINMMNFFFRVKIPTYAFFDYMAMFVNVSTAMLMRMVRIVTLNKFITVIENDATLPVVVRCPRSPNFYGWHYPTFFMSFRNLFSYLWPLCPVHNHSFGGGLNE